MTERRPFFSPVALLGVLEIAHRTVGIKDEFLLTYSLFEFVAWLENAGSHCRGSIIAVKAECCVNNGEFVVDSFMSPSPVNSRGLLSILFSCKSFPNSRTSCVPSGNRQSKYPATVLDLPAINLAKYYVEL